MSENLVFYYNPQSRAQIVRWMLEEVGAAYRLVPVDFEAGDNRTPAFLAINPMGKLPVLVDRGVVVTETAAICAHLADRFPEAGLAPAVGTPERGTWYRWLFFGAGCIDPALTDRMLDRPPPTSRVALGYGSYDDVLATLKATLADAPYLVGDRFTAADLFVGAQLYWAGMFGAPGIKGDPVFDDYVTRMTARPAAARAAGG